MRVLLDSQDIGVDSPGFPGAIEAGVAACQALGRVVVEVKVDGKVLNDQDLRSLVGRTITISLIELTSADPRILVAGTLLQASEALGRARETQQAAAELIHAGKPDDAMERLGSIFETWQAVQQALEQGGTLLGVKLGDVEVDPDRPGGLSKAAGELMKDLMAVRDGLAGSDWSAVGDALAFDLEAQAVRWQAGLRRVAEILAGRGGGAGGKGSGPT